MQRWEKAVAQTVTAADRRSPSELRRLRRDRQAKALKEMPALIMPRILFAELLGTWALVTVAAGGGVISAVSGGQVSQNAQVVAPALAVAALIYVLGPISGAHFNPVVTLAFALRGDFPWRHLPSFWLIQVAGSILAALILRALFGMAGHLGTTVPHHGVGTSLVMEIILTFLLVTVILGTASDRKIVGANAALAVGFTIALDGLFAAPISGSSMNPARSLGPAIASWNLTDQWIYIAGPVAGATLAALVAFVLRGMTTLDAIEAATGTLTKEE